MKFYLNKLKNKLEFFFLEGINVTQTKKEIIQIKLPMFIDTGNLIEIKLKITDEKIMMYNSLYRDVIQALEYKFEKENKNVNILEGYLEKKSMFKELKQNILIKNKIEADSLLQEKSVYFIKQTKVFEEEIGFEILFYAKLIQTYYNHVYHHILANAKGEKRKNLMESAMERYLDKLSKLYNKDYEIICKEKVYSKTNEYFKIDDKILTSNNNKVHFMESILDFEKLYDLGEYSLGYLIVNINGKNDLNKDYINNFEEKLKKINVKCEIVEVNTPTSEIKIEDFEV